jgi:excisionase family DNA binding protein
MSSSGNVTQRARYSRVACYKHQVHHLSDISHKQFWSAEELAERLNVNITTIYRYIKTGKILANKVGREFQITDSEFHKFESKCSKWS